MACKGEAISRAKKGKPTGLRAPRVTVKCEYCGKKKQMRQKELKYQERFFCNHSHRAKVLAGERDMAIGATGRSGWTKESRRSYLEKMTGPRNPAWRGGVTIFRKHGNYAGVRYVRAPASLRAMARKDGYVMEHRMFVAQAIGRLLLRSEVVHHVDHDVTNNRLSNLLLFASNKDHKLFEHHGTPSPIWCG
jgi:hypothetical protein